MPLLQPVHRPLRQPFRGPFAVRKTVYDGPPLVFDFMDEALPAGATLTRASAGTYFDQTGIMQSAAPDLPRFDYDAGVLQGLLVEPARTNLVDDGSEFSQWSILGTPVVTADQGAAPDTSLTADLIAFDNTFSFVRQNNRPVVGQAPYVLSFWVESVDQSEIEYRVFDNTNNGDLVSQTNYEAQLVVGQFVRVAVPFMTAPTTTLVHVYVQSGSATGSARFWGAVLEPAPQTSTILSGSRSADVLHLDLPAASFAIDIETPVGTFTREADIAGGWIFEWPQDAVAAGASHVQSITARAP